MASDPVLALARKLKPCAFCNGRGIVRYAAHVSSPTFTEETCRYCGGAGHFHNAEVLEALRVAFTADRAELLRAAASWFDREYERVVQSRKQPKRRRGNESRSAAQIDGRLDVLADAGAILRSWAANGFWDDRIAKRQPNDDKESQ